MSMTQVFRTVFRNLLANKVRFVQRMLALISGVTGLVVVLALSFALVNFNDQIFDLYSPGILNCYVKQNAAYLKTVDVAEMERLVRDNPEVIMAVTPVIWSPNMPLILRNGEKVYKDAILQGVSEGYLATYKGLYIQDGRFLQSMDVARQQRVCVLGKIIADVLFDGDALGKTLKIYGENYRVVGILSDSYFANYDLLIPYTVARKEIFGQEIYSYANSADFYEDQYYVVANGSENMSEARQLIEDMLRKETGGETGSIYDFGTRWTLRTYGAGSAAELMKGGIFAYFYFCLLAVGFVLLIGCVGVMNVMLASVQERMQEIGIRRAFGATNRDIQRQFTLETVATSLIGGALGVVLGLGAVVIMAMAGVVVPVNGGYQINFEDINWQMLSLAILLALASCVGVGVLAALYPAQQAVKMEIVDAINKS